MTTTSSGAGPTGTATLPAPASPARRALAACLDALLALLCGLAAWAAGGVTVADGAVEPRLQDPAVWGGALGVALAFSFCNHVLLGLTVRAGLGKLVTGLRTVRAVDGGRPGLPRLVGRWLFGFYWTVVFVPLHIAAGSDVEQQDAVGLRTVRRPR